MLKTPKPYPPGSPGEDAALDRIADGKPARTPREGVTMRPYLRILAWIDELAEAGDIVRPIAVARPRQPTGRRRVIVR